MWRIIPFPSNENTPRKLEGKFSICPLLPVWDIYVMLTQHFLLWSDGVTFCQQLETTQPCNKNSAFLLETHQLYFWHSLQGNWLHISFSRFLDWKTQWLWTTWCITWSVSWVSWMLWQWVCHEHAHIRTGDSSICAIPGFFHICFAWKPLFSFEHKPRTDRDKK